MNLRLDLLNYTKHQSNDTELWVFSCNLIPFEMPS